MPYRRLLALFSAIALALGALSAAAGGLGQPEGRVLLRVTGAIHATNAGDAAIFDRTMLAALGEETIETTTIWTDGPQRFTGVSLSNLLQALGVEGSEVLATAINDYSIKIPSGDAIPEGALIAYARNGKPMSIRDKGPLWVIYPYDHNARYRSEVYYSRSIWQLDRIEVLR